MDRLNSLRFEVWFSTEDKCWIGRVEGPPIEGSSISGHGSSPNAALRECLVALDLALGPWADGLVCEACGTRLGQDPRRAMSAAMGRGTCVICGMDAFVLDASEFGGVRFLKEPSIIPGALASRFEERFAAMQTQESKAGVKALFKANPEELGRAAVLGVVTSSPSSEPVKQISEPVVGHPSTLEKHREGIRKHMRTKHARPK